MILFRIIIVLSIICVELDPDAYIKSIRFLFKTGYGTYLCGLISLHRILEFSSIGREINDL
ncbi:hypothetical protein PAHAL_2G236500 [Panicum hallii]|uniref:Uncharacterized protein n=1 Tax=Panicum hallii TaxID=206008 RepID=A0A2T8KQ87_9POAL|nr:hypothetical protein PAHAL_2G236500 [Panicum hallii]